MKALIEKEISYYADEDSKRSEILFRIFGLLIYKKVATENEKELSDNYKRTEIGFNGDKE